MQYAIAPLPPSSEGPIFRDVLPPPLIKYHIKTIPNPVREGVSALYSKDIFRRLISDAPINFSSLNFHDFDLFFFNRENNLQTSHR